MDRINRSILTGVALVGISALGAAQPATQPSTQPVVAAPLNDYQPTNRQERGNRRNRSNRGGSSPSFLVSDPYAVLRTRSIFVKGNQTIANDAVSTRFTRPGDLEGVSGSKLVFNGVIFFGDEPNAMIEDTGSGNVSLVRAGDLIAAGKVSAITFDDMTYEANGQQKHVSLGENMDGVVPTVTASASASVPTTLPTGAPDASMPAATIGAAAVTAPPPAGSGGSPEEILARMKAKRNQELGIK